MRSRLFATVLHLRRKTHAVIGGRRRTNANETETETARGYLVQLTSIHRAACLPDTRDRFGAHAEQGSHPATWPRWQPPRPLPHGASRSTAAPSTRVCRRRSAARTLFRG